MESFLGPGSVKLRCKICGGNAVRSHLYSDMRWVHVEDEMIFKKDGAVIGSQYDHEVQPDTIEAKVIHESGRGVG